MTQLPKERYNDDVETRNFRLRRTVGTTTKFSVDDKRTGISIGFDHASVGIEMGRGDTIQLYVDEEELARAKQIASIYQHDVCDHLLEAFEHISEESELPEADYVKDELENDE